MTIKTLPSAEEDIIKGANFYEKQKRGLADYFIDTIFSDIDSLQIYAGVHPIISGFYRLLSKRFPYAIYYKLSGNDVFIYAILDTPRNPTRITKRLRKK